MNNTFHFIYFPYMMVFSIRLRDIQNKIENLEW